MYVAATAATTAMVGIGSSETRKFNHFCIHNNKSNSTSRKNSKIEIKTSKHAHETITICMYCVRYVCVYAEHSWKSAYNIQSKVKESKMCSSHCRLRFCRKSKANMMVFSAGCCVQNAWKWLWKERDKIRDEQK